MEWKIFYSSLFLVPRTGFRGHAIIFLRPTKFEADILRAIPFFVGAIKNCCLTWLTAIRHSYAEPFNQLYGLDVTCGFASVIAQYDTYTNRREGEEGGLTPWAVVQITLHVQHLIHSQPG